MADPAADETRQRPAEVTPLPRTETSRPPPFRRRLRWPRAVLRATLRLFLLVVVPLAGAAVGFDRWVAAGRFVSTDNAYIRADSVAVAAEVQGRVTEVLVSSNDRVSWGEVLFRLDDRPFRIALEEAEMQLSMVRTEIAVLRAQYRRRLQQVERTRTDAAYYQREFDRKSGLAARNVIAEAAIDEARHDLAQAEQAAAVAERELGEVLARLGGNPDTPDELFYAYNNARARRDRRALDLENTVIRAPADGIIARVKPRPGTYVDIGEPVISLVETAAIWLEANLKESQLTHLAVGQPATMTVDAWPGHEWELEVASFSPATGAEFSLLPPQNATGNWVKVIQRVPVRFHIREEPDGPTLRVGMSATVTIDTGREHAVPEFLAAPAALVRTVVERWLPDQ